VLVHSVPLKDFEEGFLWRSELRQCELFHGACNITQCFKCQKYGHTAKHCRSRQRCGYCAGYPHSDSECDIRGKGGARGRSGVGKF